MRYIAAACLLVITGCGGESPAAAPTPAPAATPSKDICTELPDSYACGQAEQSDAPTTPAEPAYGTPTKAHFKLTPKVLRKKCFGSAGCNVDYRIIVDYTGPTLDPSTTYEVLYEVRGGDDGVISNRLTITGDTSSVDEEESTGTKSSKSKLTAVVTEVLG